MTGLGCIEQLTDGPTEQFSRFGTIYKLYGLGKFEWTRSSSFVYDQILFIFLLSPETRQVLKAIHTGYKLFPHGTSEISSVQDGIYVLRKLHSVFQTFPQRCLSLFHRFLNSLLGSCYLSPSQRLNSLLGINCYLSPSQRLNSLPGTNCYLSPSQVLNSLLSTCYLSPSQVLNSLLDTCYLSPSQVLNSLLDTCYLSPSQVLNSLLGTYRPVRF